MLTEGNTVELKKEYTDDIKQTVRIVIRKSAQKA